jgi:hypothetical protein
MRRPVVERAESGKPEIWLSSFGADIGASRHRPVERREAPGPTSLGSRASKRRVRVTGLCRRRAADRVMVCQGGFARRSSEAKKPADSGRISHISGQIDRAFARRPRSMGWGPAARRRAGRAGILTRFVAIRPARGCRWAVKGSACGRVPHRRNCWRPCRNDHRTKV